MILDIILEDNPIIRQKSEKIPKVTSEIKELLRNMSDTLHSQKGLGIAAPQVGKNIRAIVVEVDKKYEMINPVIVKARKPTLSLNEGCLSIPNKTGSVERYDEIRVEYINRLGSKKVLKATGMLSFCIQHEIDHLNGILFTDKAVTLIDKNND